MNEQLAVLGAQIWQDMDRMGLLDEWCLLQNGQLFPQHRFLPERWGYDERTGYQLGNMPHDVIYSGPDAELFRWHYLRYAARSAAIVQAGSFAERRELTLTYLARVYPADHPLMQREATR